MEETSKRFYEENGYVLIRQAATDKELGPVREQIGKVVDRKINAFYRQGLITNKHEELPLSTRWSEISKQHPSKEQMWVRQVFSKAIYDLGIHDPVLDAVETLIGSEIRFNGDYHVRPKIPHHDLTTVPWHQDAYYYGGKEAGNPDYPILSVWIPLIDVDEHNGCLQFVPGSHKWGLTPELNQALPRIGDKPVVSVEQKHELDHRAISLRMSKGDMVIFDKFTFHRSLPNLSDEIRWSVDLRYSPADQSFAWSGMGDEIDVKYPSCIVRSQTQPDRVSNWEQYENKFTSTCDRYDEDGVAK
ncbi:phytanoyl-CoA dioxygenase family protein [Paenibacillus cymbidii]|uniref:phytanoyl-CoA dioxygenase family protein n=1 Tax=Paenibacillus cymbidii TaxID=1639034 RepID=UPI001436A3A7|nr:phytanoyl-CoA dioxygenase family protein [Paenibacillus cymbidii]